MSVTYTIIDHTGTPIETGATVEEAARAILLDDGYEYDIRHDDGGGWTLWHSRHSRASTSYDGLHRTLIYSIEDDAAKAEAEIFSKVLASASHFGHFHVMTDAAYADMEREFARERAG